MVGCKRHLTEETMIVLLDFAENYSFVVQDAIQGHQLHNSQATLHPFTIYHLKYNTIARLSICVVSDCMQHHAITVHAFINLVLSYIKDLHPSAQ